MRNTKFQKLVKHLKREHNATQQGLANILGIHKSTFSNAMHNDHGMTGAKHVNKLQELIDTLEANQSKPKLEVVTPYCTKCNNAHTHHPQKGECYS